MAFESVLVSFEGQQSTFHVENPKDHIQGFHRRGSFYELRQLLTHRDLIPMESTVLDVGANVGNHTIFYARHTFAKLVYPVEPNPRSLRLLQASIGANQGTRARISSENLGIAVGSIVGSVEIVDSAANNLGAAQVRTAGSPSSETIPLRPLDDLEFEGPISFIKIDVEGMELEVLRGARQLLEKHRPAVAIEVIDRHDRQLWEWAEASKYRVIGSFVDYLKFKNYILIPAH